MLLKIGGQNQMKLISLSLLMSLSVPLYAVETELTEQKKAYCMNWADRFLSIKDGQHYRENKISAAKFPMYVELCLEHYVELRNMYKKKIQNN